MSWQMILDLFIPHPGNDHRPHALRHPVLAGYSAFLIALKIAAVAIPVLLPNAFVFSSAVTSANIISLTNQARKAAGLSPLKNNVLLTNAAQAKAQDMMDEGYFAHTSPAGKTPWDFIKQAGYRYLYSGENLAVHFTTAEAVENGWMLSAKHHANIVNPRFEDIGVGIASGVFEGTSTLVVVQMFGAPESKYEARPAAVIPAKAKTPPPPQPPVVREDVANVFSEGVTTDDTLQRGVENVYLFAIAFIVMTLIASLSIHYRMKHALQLAHGMAVIGLAVVLLMV